MGMDKEIKIEIPVLTTLDADMCAHAKDEKITFAYYGSENICIHKDGVTMSVDKDNLHRILKMLNDIMGVEISRGRRIKTRP